MDAVCPRRLSSTSFLPSLLRAVKIVSVAEKNCVRCKLCCILGFLVLNCIRSVPFWPCTVCQTRKSLRYFLLLESGTFFPACAAVWCRQGAGVFSFWRSLALLLHVRLSLNARINTWTSYLADTCSSECALLVFALYPKLAQCISWQYGTAHTWGTSPASPTSLWRCLLRSRSVGLHVRWWFWICSVLHNIIGWLVFNQV